MSFKFHVLVVTLIHIVFGLYLLGARQEGSAETRLLWKDTLAGESKRTRTAVPKAIMKAVRAKPGGCLYYSPTEAKKVDGYLRRVRNLELIAIWGRSSCFCSPTGNCAFWIFQFRGGKYDVLLDTDMVREFGFLGSTTNGLPDLVLWSHDSAQRFPGALWKFNGQEYVRECGWEIVTTFKDLPSGGSERVESHVENSTCVEHLIPESESEKDN